MPGPMPTWSFDIRAINEALDRAKKRDASIAVAFMVFCAAILLLVLWDDLPRALHGTLSNGQLFVLVVGTVGLTCILAIGARGLPRKRKGARSLIIDFDGIEMTFPDRESRRFRWADPTAVLELQDLSKVDPRVLSVSTPYFMVARDVHSALTQEAFDTILAQAEAHGLNDVVGPPRRWFAPSKAWYHMIRGGPSARSTV